MDIGISVGIIVGIGVGGSVGAGVNLDTMKFNMILVMHPGVAEETFVISLGVSEKASDATQCTA